MPVTVATPDSHDPEPRAERPLVQLAVHHIRQTAGTGARRHVTIVVLDRWEHAAELTDQERLVVLKRFSR